jgi:glutathione S-transferase
MERTLVILPVSPWSERARWALDHHHLPYRTMIHAPFLGERKLKKLIGPTTKRATVPVLLEGAQRFTDSADIARHADAIGSGDKLFPDGRDADVARFVALADDTMAAGRALITKSLLESDGALDEALPPSVPSPLRPLSRPITRYATRWFARKYALDLDDTGPAEAKVRAGLDAVRTALSSSKPYLLGTFSWADISACSLLQAVRPVDHPLYKLGPATRQQWTSPALSSSYPDLLEWRDALYARHRGARARQP